MLLFTLRIKDIPLFFLRSLLTSLMASNHFRSKLPLELWAKIGRYNDVLKPLNMATAERSIEGGPHDVILPKHFMHNRNLLIRNGIKHILTEINHADRLYDLIQRGYFGADTHKQYVNTLRTLKTLIDSQMDSHKLYRCPEIAFFVFKHLGSGGLSIAGNPIDEHFVHKILDRFISYWKESNHFPINTIIQMLANESFFKNAKKQYVLKSLYHNSHWKLKFINKIIRAMPKSEQTLLISQLKRLPQPLYDVTWTEWMDAALKRKNPGQFSHSDWETSDLSESDDSDSDSDSDDGF